MSTTYVITGASRGIGFGFLKNLSEDPNNLVIGLVRDKKATQEKISAELGGRSNVHIVEADLVKADQVRETAKTVSSITGGSLDYLIANAGVGSDWSAHRPINELAEHPERLEEDFLWHFRINVLGNLNLYTAYLPLILKGKEKKVITLSSAMGDLNLIRQAPIKIAAPYAVSKAALNALVAKHSAQYADEGVLFLAVCPGLADTGVTDNLSEEEQAHLGGFVAACNKHAPGFRIRSPDEAAADALSIIEKSSLSKGDGGLFVSHLGSTTQWL